MITILCECDWGTGTKLPPHMHVQEGRIEMPDGRKTWVPGCISEEMRQTVSFSVRWTKGDVATFFDQVRNSGGIRSNDE